VKEHNIEKFIPDPAHDFDGREPNEFHPYYMTPTLVAQDLLDPYAFRIWSYLQSLPPDWDVRKEQIKSHLKISENVYTRSMSLLKRCRLIEYRNYKNSKNQFVRTKIRVLSGKDYIKMEDLDKIYPQEEKKTTPMKSIVVEESVEISHSHGFHSSGNPYVWKPTPLTNNIDIQNIKTTTTDQVEKNNHPLKGDISTVHSSSRLVFDLSCVKKFGIEERHIEQLMDMGIPHLAIQESMENFSKHMSYDGFSAKIQNPVAYFMGTMRRARYYSAPMTQKQSDADYEKRIERQEEIRRSRELAAQAHDERYGISLDDLADKLKEAPRHIASILSSHVKILDPNTMQERAGCV